jgi:transcriptional regulator with XRE-family HTH domain
MVYGHYSEDDKARALAALKANGGNVSRTAREMGIKEPTLRKWANGKTKPIPSQKYEEKVTDLTVGLRSLVAGLMGLALVKVDEGDASLLDVLKSLGIAFDKLQLIEGKPTERTAVVNEPLTDDERITRAASLFDAARARRVGSPAEDRTDWAD